jgi:hypothetical protein
VLDAAVGAGEGVVADGFRVGAVDAGLEDGLTAAAGCEWFADDGRSGVTER